VRRLRLSDGQVEEIRSSVDDVPDATYLPQVEAMTFSGPHERDVHCFVYSPRNPDFTGPSDERPPYVAFVHGGPTAHDPGILDVEIAFFTSRGIGVVVVNYGGSTGYGRAYREALRGQWGIVDVEDTVTALHGLVERGLADGTRLAIRGGSAGGWTVLAALTGTEAFACGTSYYGVAELLEFASDTHDFESRYLDGLVGPLPESRDLYEARAPLNHVDTLSCPVLLLQGLDDPIVPPRQAELFRDALVRKGIPHAYLAFEGESHGFRRADTNITCLEAELSFYGQVLGFEPAGVPTLALTSG
jgi:dipeptidyl aminopeptidase/acylaminoacyl peptidase